jgi:hypothetical protein
MLVNLNVFVPPSDSFDVLIAMRFTGTTGPPTHNNRVHSASVPAVPS